MVDSFNTSETVSGTETAAGSQQSGLAGFFATRTGRIVLGGIAVVVVLGIIAAMVGYFVLGMFQTPSGDTGVLTPPAAATTETAAVPTERKPLSPEDVYTFRNIFAPTVKPSEVSSSTTTTGGSQAIPADTLVLQSFLTQDGVAKANLYWNGTVYPLAEGEVIQGTPWELLDISGGSVVMLYGDSRVTLTVGQGVAK